MTQRSRHIRSWQRPGGFTLVELLVVISVIMLLISIMLPALAQARRAGRRSVCLSNLKQIGIATAGYAADSGDTTPAYREWSTYYVQSHANSTSKNFVYQLMGNNYTALYCPLDKLNPDHPYGWNGTFNAATAWLQISYSMVGMWYPTGSGLGGQDVYYNPPNSWYTNFVDLPLVKPTNRPARYTSMPMASRIAIATDAQETHYYAGPVPFCYPGYLWVEDKYNEMMFPHRRADGTWDETQAVFFDGHAANRKREAMIVGTPGVDYPNGAKWFMWKGRVGGTENALFW